MTTPSDGYQSSSVSSNLDWKRKKKKEEKHLHGVNVQHLHLNFKGEFYPSVLPMRFLSDWFFTITGMGRNWDRFLAWRWLQWWDYLITVSESWAVVAFKLLLCDVGQVGSSGPPASSSPSIWLAVTCRSAVVQQQHHCAVLPFDSFGQMTQRQKRKRDIPN